jgi:hypothetical protein
MTDFDDLIRSVEEEAKAEGPEAMAELEPSGATSPVSARPSRT